MGMQVVVVVNRLEQCGPGGLWCKGFNISTYKCMFVRVCASIAVCCQKYLVGRFVFSKFFAVKHGGLGVSVADTDI